MLPPHQHTSGPTDAKDIKPTATGAQPGATTRWGRRMWWVRVALVVYWLALFAGTHLPPPPQMLSVSNIDKLMHLLAYAGLSFLLVMTCAQRRVLTAAYYAQLLVLVAIYGIVDEVLQSFVGRTCEFWDWVADVIGAAAGLALFHLTVYRRRRVKPRE